MRTALFGWLAHAAQSQAEQSQARQWLKNAQKSLEKSREAPKQSFFSWFFIVVFMFFPTRSAARPFRARGKDLGLLLPEAVKQLERFPKAGTWGIEPENAAEEPGNAMK